MTLARAAAPAAAARPARSASVPPTGKTTQPNACIDDIDVAGDGTLCVTDGSAPTDTVNEGHCTEGPVDQQCEIETFRGCLANVDCPAAGDSCGSGPRLCYLDNGVVGGSVSAFGMADAPSNGESDPTFAALFCVGKHQRRRQRRRRSPRPRPHRAAACTARRSRRCRRRRRYSSDHSSPRIPRRIRGLLCLRLALPVGTLASSVSRVFLHGRVRTMRRHFAMIAVASLAFLITACGDNDNSTDSSTPEPTVPAPTSTVPNPGPTSTVPNPGPTSTAPPQIPCPQLITYTVVSAGSDLDVGWTGIYHDQVLGDGGALSFALDCAGDFLGRCGDCALTGPIASTTVVDNHRCKNASQTKCTSNDQCPGSTCEFFFGAPLPISGVASRSA